MLILDYIGIPSESYQQGQSFAHLFKYPEKNHREAIFAEACTPDATPPPFDIAEYDKVNQARADVDGWQWFIDYTTNGRSAMIRKDEWKYCFNSSDAEELYDLANDPIEIKNLAKDHAYIEKKDELKSMLMNWLLVEPSKAGRALSREASLSDNEFSIFP
ncbi:MAG: hypothetical protein AAGB46_12310 [Verrucomicrobiota bacterium]